MATTKKISKHMIQLGFQDGIIRLIDTNEPIGPVCEIGGHEFYFPCPSNADLFKTASQFQESYSATEIVDILFNALSDLAEENGAEYLLFYQYLDGCDMSPDNKVSVAERLDSANSRAFYQPSTGSEDDAPGSRQTGMNKDNTQVYD